MSHFVAAIFIYNIFQYSFSAVFIKINIDIGHRCSVNIKESLKQQSVLYRINISDPETVSYS